MFEIIYTYLKNTTNFDKHFIKYLVICVIELLLKISLYLLFNELILLKKYSLQLLIILFFILTILYNYFYNLRYKIHNINASIHLKLQITNIKNKLFNMDLEKLDSLDKFSLSNSIYNCNYVYINIYFYIYTIIEMIVFGIITCILSVNNHNHYSFYY